MPVLTIGGQAGAGGPEIGVRVARTLGIEYFERRALRMVAEKLGASLEAVVLKERLYGSWTARLRALFEQWLLDAGRLGYGYDPMVMPAYGADAYAFLDDEADDEHPLRISPSEIPDREFVEVVRQVGAELAERGDVVLVKRAGCLTLRDEPGVLHVGLFAPREERVRRFAGRFGVGIAEAESMLADAEKARRRFFKRLAGAHPHDEQLYDLALDTTQDADDAASALRIASAVAAA